MDASVAANEERCFGPGGGGAGGLLRYKGAVALAGITADLTGGSPGLVVNSTASCNGTPVTATNGSNGVEEFSGEIPEGEKCNRFCASMTQVDLGNDISTCQADTVVLDAGVSGPQYTYEWSSGDTTQTINVSGQGTYLVIVDDGYCFACDSVDVMAFEEPDVPSHTFFTICDVPEVVLDAENTGYRYNWNTGDTTQTIIIQSGGNFWVDIYNQYCGIRAYFEVDDCVNPSNTITPNGDGYNDYWSVPGLNKYPDNEVWIYNRRGQVIYHRKGYLEEFNGDGLPEGVYYYKLDLKNNTEPLKGTITLLR